MKKLWAVALIAAVCLAVVAIADEKKMDRMSGKSMEATITKVDMSGKMMTVKDAAGKETTIYWSDSTKLEGGTMKEGETVHVKASEKDGKMWATWIHVGAMRKM
jgi:hypothetical protein